MVIDICVCTYKRQHVAETLRSLARQSSRPDWDIRIIVADNDETASARELVDATARECGLTLTYIHAPARNISVARNACLDAATAPLVAFIDDDVEAEPTWLNALLAVIETRKADVVLGPVQAVYDPECPDWIVEGDFFSARPVWVHGEIVTGYSCNVLFRRTAAAVQGLRFREEFGRTGGEDTIFFAAVHRAGGVIAYAPDAIVTEAVPDQRAHLQWLLKRSFRAGQTHGTFLLEANGTKPLVRTRFLAMAFAKAVFCLMMVVPNILKAARAHYWLLRGILHCGVVARLLGKGEIQQYG
jgi:succinoglycan biosynthesis protein ExoM